MVSCFVGKRQKDIVYPVKLYAFSPFVFVFVSPLLELLHLAQMSLAAEGPKPPGAGAEHCESALSCPVKPILFSGPWSVLSVKMFSFPVGAVPPWVSPSKGREPAAWVCW